MASGHHHFCNTRLTFITFLGSVAVACCWSQQPDVDFKVKFTDYDCMRIPNEEMILDWAQLFHDLTAWLDKKPPKSNILADDQVESTFAGISVHLAPQVIAIKDACLRTVKSDVRTRARQQCPIGVLCLCIFEATALVSMRTEDVEAKFQCIQELMAETPVYALVGAKWPVFRMLNFLWTLNKVSAQTLTGYKNMNRFVQRQYADFNLSPSELAPFGMGRVVPWQSWLWVNPDGSGFASAKLEEMIVASKSAYNSFSVALQGLASAVWQSVIKDGLPANGRPLIRISLVFGSSWAELLPLSWARWGALGFRAHIFVAMDEDAVRMCIAFHLTCVPTGVPSVLHKYSITALALHLGIDVLYCDLDAVPIGPDIVKYLHEYVDDKDGHTGADIAVSTHNYDCLNAGVWYARATSASASFFLLLLEYLYDHWYEGDQRSFNAFATGNVSVSYESKVKAQLPYVQIFTLPPDVFAGTEGIEDISTVQIFHAYKIYNEDKQALARQLYGEADLPPGIPTRSSLWDWAQDSATQFRVQKVAREILKKFIRTRTSTQCW